MFFIKDVPFDLFPCWLTDDQLISASHKIVNTENDVEYSRMTLWQYSADIEPTGRHIRSQLVQLTSGPVSTGQKSIYSFAMTLCDNFSTSTRAETS